MTPVPVVALVGSAGGLDAVSRVLAPLPADLGACVLVLIHQAPDRVSHLVDILGRRTDLPITAAGDGDVLHSRQVLVAPPGKHLLVTPDRSLRLIVSGAAPPSRPSADLLLTTMAVCLRSDAVAVVLSGGGHDGATGATAVHAFGGTVIASDELSSAHPSMPLATIERDHAIDLVAPLDEIAAHIGALGGPQLEHSA